MGREGDRRGNKGRGGDGEELVGRRGDGTEESGQKEARKGEGVQEVPLTPGIRPGAEAEGRSETGRGRWRRKEGGGKT